MLKLNSFLSKPQSGALNRGLRGEEKEAFQEIIKRLTATINTMPKTYEQDGLGDKAVAHLHYFRGDQDFYITEKDAEDEQLQAFGLADLGYGAELGYISIIELTENDVELDFYFSPKTLKEIKSTQTQEVPHV